MTPPPVETAVIDSFEPTLEGGTSQIGLFLILIFSPTVATMRFHPIMVPSPRAIATAAFTHTGMYLVASSNMDL